MTLRPRLVASCRSKKEIRSGKELFDFLDILISPGSFQVEKETG